MPFENLTDHRTLTEVVNNIKLPAQFIRTLLFPSGDGAGSNVIELSTWEGTGRQTAPFVRRGAEGRIVQGFTSTIGQVTIPYIRLKMPFEISRLMGERFPGQPLYVSDPQLDAIRSRVALDLSRMSMLLDQTEEYMACQIAFEGALTYSDSQGDSFSITYPKAAKTNLGAADEWDSGTQDIRSDFHEAKRTMSTNEGLPVTDAIMGSAAAAAFLSDTDVKSQLDNRNIIAGQITFAEQFTEAGAIFLGVYSGVRCWEYSRQITHLGSTVNLCDPNDVHFIGRAPTQFVTDFKYGTIDDWVAVQSGMANSRRFSKSWETDDPSVSWGLIATSPLPILRKPNFVLTYIVL